MAIFNILHTEWSDGWGGQEIRILDECRGLADLGHRVELAGCPRGKLRARAEAAGLVFHPLDMAGAWDLAALLGLAGLIRRRGVQIVHTHSSVDSWLGGMAARLTGAAAVRTRHLSAPVNTSPLNFVYRLPRAVITTGQGIRRHLVQDYGLPAERVISIPTGVDLARFAPREPDLALQDELGQVPGQPVVAIIAVLRSWKRHDIFCEMARLVLESRPDTRFLIVGHGPGWDRVNGYLDQMNLRPAAVMTGHREDIERILPLCTVCVLPSDKNEGVPQAVLQQLACERAVVGAAAGDIPEVVIDGQTGLLVPPGEAAPLAEAVTRLLDDEGLRRRLGGQGRVFVAENYSRQSMLRRTEEVYQKVLAGQPPGEGR